MNKHIGNELPWRKQARFNRPWRSKSHNQPLQKWVTQCKKDQHIDNKKVFYSRWKYGEMGIRGVVVAWMIQWLISVIEKLTHLLNIRGIPVNLCLSFGMRSNSHLQI